MERVARSRTPFAILGLSGCFLAIFISLSRMRCESRDVFFIIIKIDHLVFSSITLCGRSLLEGFRSCGSWEVFDRVCASSGCRMVGYSVDNSGAPLLFFVQPQLVFIG